MNENIVNHRHTKQRSREAQRNESRSTQQMFENQFSKKKKNN
jgi:hypothetical protein